MVRDIGGNNNNNGITVDGTGATSGSQVNFTLTNGATISGSGRIDDISLGGGNNTLVVKNAFRDTSQDDVTFPSQETRIGDITSGNGNNRVEIINSGGRDSLNLGRGSDTVELKGSYFQEGVFTGGGRDRVEVSEGDARPGDFAEKNPFLIDGGSGIDTLGLIGDFTISFNSPVMIDTTGDGVGNEPRTSLTRAEFEKVVNLPQNLTGAVTLGEAGIRFNFQNFEEIRAFICFTRGTMIRTPKGEVAIEALKKGDMVTTRDGGNAAIRWIGSRKLDSIDLAANPRLRPVRISAGALGDGLPTQDLTVSPQHRVLVSSAIAERMVGQRDVLVAAKQLVGAPGIAFDDGVETVEYFHFLLDAHRVVWSNGAPSESLYTGLEALKSLSAGARQEIFELFPELEAISEEFQPSWQPAAFLMPGRLARTMLDRHVKNAKPLSTGFTESEHA